MCIVLFLLHYSCLGCRQMHVAQTDSHQNGGTEQGHGGRGRKGEAELLPGLCQNIRKFALPKKASINHRI